MTDKEIISRCWARDDYAIHGMMATYSLYCSAIAGRILALREDVDECLNDTWLGAWNAMPPKHPNNLRIFLGKITRNLSIDRYRRAHSAKRGGGEMDAVLEELAECLTGSQSPEEALVARELEAAIQKFLRRLPQKECSVFLRRYFYLEPVAEIAQGCGIPENQVYVLLHRSRTKLKTMLEQEGYL